MTQHHCKCLLYNTLSKCSSSILPSVFFLLLPSPFVEIPFTLAKAFRTLEGLAIRLTGEEPVNRVDPLSGEVIVGFFTGLLDSTGRLTRPLLICGMELPLGGGTRAVGAMDVSSDPEEVLSVSEERKKSEESNELRGTSSSPNIIDRRRDLIAEANAGPLFVREQSKLLVNGIGFDRCILAEGHGKWVAGRAGAEPGARVGV